jgi:hypothetical protein
VTMYPKFLIEVLKCQIGVESNFLHWNTCMCIFHISTCKMSPRCTGCFIVNGTVPHTHSVQEALFCCGTKPKLLYNLLLTVWSIKLQQMFAVFQTEGPINPNLHEVIVQITDNATCNNAHNGIVTDRMVCTLPPSGFMGPCYVRCL